MSNPRILAEPVLVGREKELEELQSCLSSVLGGKGKTVFVSGEAGSGKTRLAREFLKVAIRSGVAVMAGWCLSDSQAPFFPFIEAFKSYYASDAQGEQSTGFQQPQFNHDVPLQIGVEEREVASWLAGPTVEGKIGKVEVLSPQVWKDQALAAIAETVHTIALQSPVILFIEDLHWADSASLALLHYLSRAVKDSDRILLLATFRSEDLTADSEGHPHPLAETLRMMRREELFCEIKLPSLDQASVSKLAESMIGSCVQPKFTEKLTAQSGGSPLFIVESLRMLNEHGGLISDGACVRLDIDKVGIPSKVKDIILRRVGSLRREQRRVLDAASVIGETFDLELLSSVLGQDSLQVVETLGAIAQSTSLLVCEGDSFRFDHAKSREALCEEIPLPIKKSYHARVAEKLEASAHGGTLLLSDIAFHYAQAGNREKAVGFALAAGNDELVKFSNEQAIKHFLYVLQNAPDVHTDDKNSALEGLGDSYYANCMYGEAIKTFDKLAATENGVAKLRAIRKASDSAYAKGDEPNLLLEYARKAEALGANDRLEMARIIDNRGHAWGWSGRGDWKMDLIDYDAALHVFEEESSLPDLVEALWRSGTLYIAYTEDSREKGIGELLRSIAISREIGDVRKEIKTRTWTAQGISQCGLFKEAKHELDSILKDGEKLGVFPDLAFASFNLAGLEWLLGNENAAIPAGLKGLEYCKKTDVNWVQGALHALLALCYSALENFEQADKHFDMLIKMPAETRSTPHVMLVSSLAKAVYFAAKDNHEEANLAFEEILEFKHVRHIRWEVTVRTRYTWALERQGRLDEATAEREKIQKILEGVEERFGHANIRLSVMVPRRIWVGDMFEMRFDMVNVGRRPCELAKIGGSLFDEFKVINLPSFCSLQGGNVEIKAKNVGPFQVETIKISLIVTKAGNYRLVPEVCYFDDLGNTKALKLDPVTITVVPAKPSFEVLPGRMTTGIMELDKLLWGGIPEKYAVVLSASSSDERQQLIKRFIEAGTSNHETTIYLTCEAANAEELARAHQNDFYVGACNPQVDSILPNLPNIIKFKGTENLTEIDIALAKLFRTLNLSQPNPKRFCVDLLSDVLLQHHAVTTRRWLSGLLASLKSKGFTVLTVIDPSIMSEEVSAISSLFEGEIRLAEKESSGSTVKTLKILKLQGQSYLKDEVTLN